jgi:UDP-glucose 4-epimerase
MNKILVTGGAGFIGSHLCERLSKIPTNEVYSLDNYFTGSVLNHLPNVIYIKGDTIDISKLINFKPKILYHLGEYSRIEQSFEDIELVFRYNKECILAVLHFVRYTGCKIIYAGSSSKFSDGIYNRFSNPYSWSKVSNIDLIINYSNWFNVSFAIAYFYNVYGKREISVGKYATLIALFKEKMKNGEPLTIVSPGFQKRNFTHVNDVVDALILIGENGFGDEYGICSDQSYSVIEVAEFFGGEFIFLPERKGNRMFSSVVVDKTRSLGWSPKFFLKDYIENLKGNNWNSV